MLTDSEKLDLLLKETSLAKDNQNELKGAVKELREFVGSTREEVHRFLARLVEVETVTDQLSDRLTKIEATQLEMKLVEKRGKWKLITIVVMSILGWIGILIKQYFGGQ
jgi:hypothetical protein